MFYSVLAPHEEIHPEIVFPDQVHGTRIVEIVTGKEDLSGCDGLFTSNPVFKLGIRTADCAPICFRAGDEIGIIHAGWRGLVDGIVEKMLKEFEIKPGLEIYVGPLLPQFEIQRDHCYTKVRKRFGERFFREQYGMLFFDFHSALKSIIPTAKFDPRSTYLMPDLASWRRDRDSRRNVTVVFRNK